MTYYIKSNNRFDIAGADAIDISTTLPPKVFTVKKDKRSEELYLEQISDFTIPEKMYGNVISHTNRIINTYYDRTVSTGILLTGEKGSGKTMLAKNISCKLTVDGIPTIIVNEAWAGDQFNEFIQSIEQPCVIMFDEFEKVYTKDEQKCMLTLLDGVYSTKKLFIFTCNDVYNINENLCNRPGRIFYTIQYAGIEDEFIRDYCNDRLNNKSHIDQVCKVAVMFAAFNFDLLQALVEEMNRYNESPVDALKILNAIPEDNDKNKFIINLSVNGIIYVDNKLDDNGMWEGNPLSPNGISFSYRKDNDAGDDWDWMRITFMPNDLTNINITEGLFTFKNKDGAIATLTKARTKFFNFSAF